MTIQEEIAAAQKRDESRNQTFDRFRVPLPHDLFCERCHTHMGRLWDPAPEDRQRKGGVCRKCLDHIQLCETMERLIAALNRGRRDE